MKIVNLTPHTIVYRDIAMQLDLSFPSEGLARVSSTSEKVGQMPLIDEVGGCVSIPLFKTSWGPVEGLPNAPMPCQSCHGAGCIPDHQGYDGCLVECLNCVEGVAKDRPVYIVSLMVLSHPDVKGRTYVVAPATGPNDGAIRFTDGPNKGQVIAVTRFIAA